MFFKIWIKNLKFLNLLSFFKFVFECIQIHSNVFFTPWYRQIRGAHQNRSIHKPQTKPHITHARMLLRIIAFFGIFVCGRVCAWWTITRNARKIAKYHFNLAITVKKWHFYYGDPPQKHTIVYQKFQKVEADSIVIKRVSPSSQK